MAISSGNLESIPAIERIGKSRCTGCYACYNSCPSRAITMHLDDEGFLFPSIDVRKCSICGFCQQFCPVLNYPKGESMQPTVFAASTNNERVRLQSSSGGINSELAKYIIKLGGVVYGASFDQSFVLRHTCAEKEDQLYAQRGSKYVQSRINDAYASVISKAKKNEVVLFCGTPCQIAALKNFVTEKSIKKNIYLCDIICHGVSSELVFKKYLEYVSSYYHRRVIEYSFRNKRFGWANYGSNAVFEDGTEYFQVHRADPFMVGYLRNITLRDACFSCPFAKIPRLSDITLGDFWGAPKKLYDKRGVSVVLINTGKGADLFAELKDVTAHLIELKNVAPYNTRLFNGESKKPVERADFFNMLASEDFQSVTKKYLTSKQTLYASILRAFSKLKRS